MVIGSRAGGAGVSRLALAAAMVLAGWGSAGADEPPFRGTVFDLSADIITEADSSSLGAVTFEENVCTNALPGKLLRSYEECLG